jgi:hypothetical protein
MRKFTISMVAAMLGTAVLIGGLTSAAAKPRGGAGLLSLCISNYTPACDIARICRITTGTIAIARMAAGTTTRPAWTRHSTSPECPAIPPCSEFNPAGARGQQCGHLGADV